MFLAENTIQLVPDGTLLVHLFFIVVMVVVLNRTLLRPINNILSEREKQITGRLNAAQELSAEADDKLKKYNAALRQARAEGYQLLEKERAAGLKEKDEKVRQHRDELSHTVAQQIETTKKQQEQVRAELESQAATMGGLISSQILRRPNQN
ncbi:MAG TPA: ATP synthase F0 subunit B [Pyrinomonadaceae bacterium]|nr:ATP synthase F0 subunit B [Pyrinomonadaceae bacterium]